MTDWKSINWFDPAALISRHFSVHEALWLPKWGRLASAEDGLNDHVKEQLVRLADLMDEVRELLGVKVIVHCWYRPKRYNELTHGASGSAHQCEGDWAAIDFHVRFEGCEVPASCSRARAALLPKLAEIGLRMENNGPDAVWIHLDTRPPVHSRYFKP
jgi:hypothetical protein